MTRATLARAVLVTALTSILAIPAFAAADTVSSVIESPFYATGTIDNQHDWVSQGAAGGFLDHHVTDLSSIGPSYDSAYQNAFGTRALRISNGQFSSGFGNQTFSPGTANEAGETSSESMGLSGGERQTVFQSSFTIASATPGAEQPGLFMAVSPDRGDGARMGMMRFIDGAAGTTINWSDYKAGDPAFTTHDLGVLSNTSPHRITIRINFYDGPTNDVVQVYVDGADVTPVEGLTTWEDYSRQFGEPPTVDELLFRTSVDAGVDAPALMGKGFLIDNVASTTPAVAANGPTGPTGTPGAAGATGPAGSNGAAGTDGQNGTVPVLASALKFGSTRSIKRKGRGVKIPVVCNASGVQICVGTLELRHGKTFLGSKGFGVRPGAHNVTVVSGLPIAANSRLKITLRSIDPSGKTYSKNLNLRVK
ncbi:MAG: hypothetical protein JHD02_03205 [Thermoleophilaceae bacterium]|nr:hypothetical protein [Thermoleophilaceae bacterium]